LSETNSPVQAKILVVDDDADIAMVLKDRLDSLGYEVTVARDGMQALEAVERETPRLMVLDLEMPRLSGIEVLQRLSQGKQRGRDGYDVPVIVMTAHGTIKKAVEAMREGAYDFVTKPIDVEHLIMTIQKASERETLKRHYEVLRSELGTKYATIIGNSPQMKSMIELAQRAANSDAGVLLLGESGTGKELFARSIHQWSPRRTAPFVVINCVALTETLLENELFGHEKGAFTGADRLEKGKVEMADGGTIFLDEIGDMPPGLQAKLLRVLQDHEFTRVGGTRLVRVNIRVIAATNKDLKQAVKTGAFREDLFFRLNVVTLTLPPLRERPQDITQLAEFFLKRHAADEKRIQMKLTAEAMTVLTRYPWPGNIRELDNMIARAVILSPRDKDEIEADQLPLSASDGGADNDGLGYHHLPYHESIDEHRRAIILRALKCANGSQTKAAEQLKLQRTYLARLIRQLNISADLLKS
jgi:DNA-binding NtrC family response regulator